jgi:hypothetical protein
LLKSAERLLILSLGANPEMVGENRFRQAHFNITGFKFLLCGAFSILFQSHAWMDKADIGLIPVLPSIVIRSPGNFRSQIRIRVVVKPQHTDIHCAPPRAITHADKLLMGINLPPTMTLKLG